MSIVPCTWRSLLAAGLLSFVALPRLNAQKQPVVLVHGIGSDGTGWTAAANRLRNEFPVNVYTPTLGSNSTFEAQALNLVNNMGGQPDTLIGIGHSNGGTVLRQASRIGRPFKGIATFGSAVQGAPIAPAVLNYEVPALVEWVARNMAVPVNEYAALPDGARESDFWWTAAYFMGRYAVRLLLAAVTALNIQHDLQQHLVLEEMGPNAPFMIQMNSAANLAREATAIPNRVRIVAKLPPERYFGLMFRGVGGNQFGEWGGVTWYTTIGFYVMNYEHYINTTFDVEDQWWFFKVTHAVDWLTAAAAMLALDPAYCAILSGGVCVENDGIVPVTRQVWSNNTGLYTVSGPSHTDEREDAGLYANGISPTMASNMRVPKCGTLAPFAVAVTGPTGSATVGTTRQLVSTVTNLCDQVMTPAVAWSSSNPTVAIVSTTGLVTARAVGTTVITASAGPVSGTMAVTVVSVPPITGLALNGPTSINTSTGGQWTAVPTGGVAPFTYNFTVNSVVRQSGTSAIFAWTPSSTGTITVGVTATDVNGSTRTTTKSVSVSTCKPGQAC